MASGAKKDDYDFLFKICITGNSGVGKSNMIMRFAHDKYNPQQTATVGIDFVTGQRKVGKHIVHYQIWDTSGQERFSAIAPAFYRGSNALVIVDDILSPKSFDQIDRWKKDFDEKRS